MWGRLIIGEYGNILQFLLKQLHVILGYVLNNNRYLLYKSYFFFAHVQYFLQFSLQISSGLFGQEQERSAFCRLDITFQLGLKGAWGQTILRAHLSSK